MRYTFPALITSSIKLCRRYKNREHLVRTRRLYRSLFLPASNVSDHPTLQHRKTTGNPK